MGESAGRRVDRWRFWVLRFRLMVERGPHSRPQASEGEAQHGPFCRTRRISQGNKYLHRGRHGQDRAGSEGGKRAGSSSAGAEKPCLSLQANWTGSRAAVAMALQLSLIHISEPTRLGMISYAVFCLKKKKRKNI